PQPPSQQVQDHEAPPFPPEGLILSGAGPGCVKHPLMSSTDAPFPFSFQNTYAALPERFHQRIAPTPVAAPKLIRVNTPLARELGLDPAALSSPEAVAVLAGNTVAPTSVPVAM